jgi:hypothetical protein
MSVTATPMPARMFAVVSPILKRAEKYGILSRNRYFTVLWHAAPADGHDFFESGTHWFLSSKGVPYCGRAAGDLSRRT